jgi:hypothetical protein
MKLPALVIAASSALALAGCVAPVGPVEVTRFHLPDTASLAKGTIAVEAAPGEDPASLELRSYQAAVTRQLVTLGYVEAAAGTPSQQVAQVRLRRETWQPEKAGSPVSVGVGGSTGSYGSGIGIGLGFDLSGKPPAQTRTELSVTIRERASSSPLWEGRAQFTVRADSPLAGTSLGSAKLAEALFQGFPGHSGETITVK